MFQGDLRRVGRSRQTLERPEIIWKRYVGTQSWNNNPVISNGRVVVGSSGVWNADDEEDGIYALGLYSGELLWFRPTGHDVNGVATHGCTVVAALDDGSIRAVTLADGAPLWTYETGAQKAYGQPAIVGNLVVVGDSQGGVHAVDLTTGLRRWHVALDGAVRGGVASDGQRVFVATAGGQAAAITLSGEELWRRPLQWPVWSVPTLVDDKVILGLVRDTAFVTPALIALEADTGSTAWEGSNPLGLEGLGGNVRASVAHSGEHIYWSSPYSNRIQAATWRDGRVVWSRSTGDCYFPQWSSPLVVGDQVVVGRFDGILHAHHAQTGESLWDLELAPDASHTDCRHQNEKGSPIVATPAISDDGVLVVGTDDGYLFGARAPSQKHSSDDAAQGTVSATPQETP